MWGMEDMAMSALFYDTLAAIWISIAGVDARWGH